MVISDLRAGSTKYFDVLILPGHLLFSCAYPLLSDGLEAELLNLISLPTLLWVFFFLF